MADQAFANQLQPPPSMEVGGSSSSPSAKRTTPIPRLVPGVNESTPELPSVLAQIRRRRLRMLALLALFAFGLGTILTLLIPRVTTPVQPLSWPMLTLCGGMSAVAISLFGTPAQSVVIR